MPIDSPGRLALVALFGSLAACAKPPCPTALPTQPLAVDGQPLTVEIADSVEERACGLSHRDQLPADHGMLFVFDVPVRSPFWMKDTRLPLSIAFVDGDGRILDLQDMIPDDGRRLYVPDLPYRYALETRQGWFREHGISPGARLSLGKAQTGQE